MLEVEGDPDMRGRTVGERREEEGEWAGGGLDGPLERVGKKKKERPATVLGRLEEKVGRAGKRKGGRKGGGPRKLLGCRGCWATGRKRKKGGSVREEGFGKFSFLKTFSNSYFKLLKLNSFQNTPRFSKHF
jgi:hypothetical protein